MVADAAGGIGRRVGRLSAGKELIMDSILLQKHLLESTYSAMDDATAATTLSVPTLQDISVSAFAALMEGTGAADVLNGIASSGTPLAPIAAKALRLMAATYETIQLGTNPTYGSEFTAAISALVTNVPAFTSAMQSAILGLAQKYPCGGIVVTADVTAARTANTFQAAVDARKIALDVYAAKIKAADQYATTIYQNFSNPNTTMPVWPADFITFVNTVK